MEGGTIKKIPKQVLKGLGRIAGEATTEALKEPGRMTGLIKDKEGKNIAFKKTENKEGDFDSVLGKVSKINPGLLEKYKDRDEEKTEGEVSEIRSQIKRTFRDVEGEMEGVRRERKKKEEEEERFLEQAKEQREAEKLEAVDDLEVPAGKKARGTAFLRGKNKAAGTGEVARKKD